jgi:hypothetical protein
VLLSALLRCGQWELPVVRRPLVEAAADEVGAGAVEGTPLGFRKEDAVYRYVACLFSGL